MFFFFTFGTHAFNSPLKGYEQVTAQCHNCGNWSAHCISRWEWFTFCFIPVLPFSLKPHKEVACPVCNFMQDLKNRPDIQSQQGGVVVQGHSAPQGPQGFGGPPGPAPGGPHYK